MRTIDADDLKEAFEIEEWYWGKRVIETIDNASTVEPNSEYGAIQYSNGFNDGFTVAKDTMIQNIAKQYSEHNELVPSWLSIGDIKGDAE